MLRTEFKNEGETQGTTSYSGKSASEAFINIPDGYDKLQYVNQYYVSTNDECENKYWPYRYNKRTTLCT